MDNTLKLLNLNRMLPEAIRKMLQTVELMDYTEAKEYAMKQARVLQKERDPKQPTLDLNEDEEETGKRKTKHKFEEETPEKEESYTNEELLAWMGKGPGKGSKGSGTKKAKAASRGPATTAEYSDTGSMSAERRTQI